jgi:hypothetical protein
MDVIAQTIQSYDDEIALLKQEIETIKKKRLHAEKVQRDHAAILCVVRLLSLEIIAMILRFALLSPLDRRGRQDFQSFRSVSRLWRQTAFSTPSLWRGLAIDVSFFDAGNQHSQARLLDLLRLWFSRAGSKDAPVSLSLETRSDRDTGWIFDALRSATLNMNTFRLCHLIFDPAVEPLERLSGIGKAVENLSLGSTFDNQPFRPIQLGSEFPVLEYLTLCSTSNRSPGSIFPVHHPSLHTLRLANITLDETTLPSLNETLPSLRTLILDKCSFIPHEVGMEPFEMTCLERLIVITTPSEEPPALCEFLVMPSLTLFQIIGNAIGTAYTYAMPGKFVAACTSSRSVTLDFSHWGSGKALRAHLILLGFSAIHRLHLSSITLLQPSTMSKSQEVVCKGSLSTTSLREWVRGALDEEDQERGDISTKIYVGKEELGLDEERDTLWGTARDVLREAFGVELVFVDAGGIAGMLWAKERGMGTRVVLGRTPFDDF